MNLFSKKIFLFSLLTLAAESFIFSAKASSVPAVLPEEQRTISITCTPHKYDLNPHTACYNAEAQLFTGLYEGLFSYNPETLVPEPAICESYKISRNRKKWTFTLKDNVFFSNGEKITAQTFYDSWITLLSNPNASFASLLDCIKGAQEFRTGQASAEQVAIQVKDKKTLTVRLKESAEHLPCLLCHNALVAVSNSENAYSGPFILESIDDKQIILKKNETYHDAASVLIPGIIIQLSDNGDENAFQFNNGLTDWISANISTGSLLSSSVLHLNANFSTHYLFFSSRNKPWDTPEIRMALLEAIDWKKFQENYFIPANTLIYPLNGYPKVTGVDEFDMDEAVILMQEARQKLNLPQDELIPLTFVIPSGDFSRKNAEFLSQSWESLGISVKVQEIDSNIYIPAISESTGDLFEFSWIGDFADPLAFLELFRSGSSFNYANYNNSEFDSLLSLAANTNDSNQHYKYLSQAEQLLLDSGEIIPMSHGICSHVIDLEKIGGWYINALDIHPLKHLYIKHVEKKIPNLVQK